MDQIQREIIQIFCIGNPTLKEVIKNERIIQEFANKGAQIAQMLGTGYHSDLKAEVSQKIRLLQNSIQHQLLMNELAEKVHSQPDLLGNSIENEIEKVRENQKQIAILRIFSWSMFPLFKSGSEVLLKLKTKDTLYDRGDIKCRNLPIHN